MRSLSQIILLLTLGVGLYAQSPHGNKLTMACADCHNPKGWKMEEGTYSFRHEKTQFPLEGMHQDVNCKSCHPSLIFSEAQSECVSCHADMHEQTVGMDCERCHSPKTWLVNNINEIHSHSRFPLTGPHMTADCYSCHPSASLLKFEPQGVECFDCHDNDYTTALNPNHVLGNFSTECLDCHNMNAFSWSSSGFNHSFFPLTEGHALNDCQLCHTGNDYSTASPECISCHQTDYNTATNPNHQIADFSTICSDCHSTQPDWKPANFTGHDGQYFPVYTGKHAGEWDNCIDCHTDPNNFATNSCIICHDHNQQDMDEEHGGIGGYVYTSAACFECHPTGEAEGGFDHNTSNFPLTGAHLTTDCLECHATGYAGTTMICGDCHEEPYNQTTNPNHIATGISNDCAACHTTEPGWIPASFGIHNEYYALTGGHAEIATDCYACHVGDYNNTPIVCFGCHDDNFNQTTNPNHVAIGIPNDCASCHTTNPEWTPATFAIHNEYYVLAGAHVSIANDCAACHNGNYNTTPNTCYGCHADDYNQTTDPPHQSAQFPTDCEACHTQTAWEPATFDHDGQYFPIYSGAHEGEWVNCSDCHTNSGNYAIFTCLPCHLQPDMDEEHNGIPGYVYNSDACLACHPDGSGAGGFNHNSTNFPLTGAHTTVDCIECHENGYSGTSTICFDCHDDAYNQSTNPNHNAIGIPNDCATCHTTNPDWSPATFAIHNDYYVLVGAHAAIANDCAACHNGNYNTTPNSCYGCHADDYNQTTDPPHQSAQFPTDCESCHTQTAWEPSTFNHDGQYFPIYSGSHNGEWDQCSDCHTNPGNYEVFTCLPCHPQGEMDDEHDGIPGYQYNSDACLACHPDGSASGAFNHNSTGFPLTGAHTTVGCIDCHENGYSGTSTLCFDCHEDAYNQSINPNHNALNIPNDCANCHTTNPDWAPASFSIHNNYYPLTGGHATVAGDCFACHNGNYNNTSTNCFDCHSNNYNQATNPNHVALSIPNDCDNCHTTNPDWAPATFAIHNNYYPLTGGHATVAGDCFACHNGNYNNTSSNCFDCHSNNYNQATNPNHVGLGIPNDCASCHTTNPDWTPATFAIHNNYYPLTGGHATVAGDCFACHNGNYNNTSSNCFDCHSNNYNQATNPNHIALGISNECATCHTTNPEWTPATFATHNSYYVLAGAHVAIANDCFVCHNGNYNATPNTCYGCHAGNYNQTNNPPHQSAQFPTDCETCHTQNTWEPSTFNHDGLYFPIYNGAHNGEWDQCSDCHTNPNNYSIFTCLTCHQQSSTNQEHNGISGYVYESNACFACHPDGSASGAFNHSSTNFPLTGAHTTVGCISCHENGYTGTSTICFDCHGDDYGQASNPNHTTLGIPNDCATCHTTNPDWTPATFSIHNNYYTLTGGHATVAGDCAACHNGNYNNTPTNCFACHSDNYNQATNPNHIALNIPNDCATCHTTNPEWTPATFATHNSYYVLAGAHVAIANDCFVCHNGNYNSTPNTCYGCHVDNYNQTTDPQHQSAQFPTECQTCHTQSVWVPSTFNHDGQYFPIYSGSHNGAWDQCNDCHTTPGNFTIFTCVTCHQQSITNQEHTGITGYVYESNACFACHPDGSASGAFNHSSTNFPLTGAHTTVGCISCHENGYAGTSTICADCHGNDYTQATNPNHTTLGIPNDCATCHTTNPDWAPATFAIHNNYYALTGGHASVAGDCAACHNGNYNNTPTNCFACHSDNYNQATNPNHVALNIPNDCATCHTTNPEWTPATFATHNSYYVLAGAHVAIANDCFTCHNGNYNTTPNTCYGCHSGDYNQTNDPPHQSAQFPTECETCHTQSSWQPSTFDHDDQYFPIYSGSHNGEWDQCSDCHNNPGNYSIFTCLTCHSQSSTNNDHEGVSGYQYNSIACLNCHPNGNGDKKMIKYF